MRIGSTVIKAFKNDDACPSQLHHYHVLADCAPVPSEDMMKGNYFETIILGKSRDGTQTLDLKRTQKGEKTAEHKRIDFAAHTLWPKVKELYKIEIQEVQVPLEVKYHDHILKTTLDIQGSIEGQPAILDLKLTGDVTNTYGVFCWGEPHLMDHSQAVLTSTLFKLVYDRQLPFFYLVFDYKPEGDFTIIDKQINELSRFELQHMVDMVIGRYEQYEQEGWITKPSYKNCHACTVADCKMRLTKKDIIRI